VKHVPSDEKDSKREHQDKDEKTEQRLDRLSMPESFSRESFWHYMKFLPGRLLNSRNFFPKEKIRMSGSEPVVDVMTENVDCKYEHQEYGKEAKQQLRVLIRVDNPAYDPFRHYTHCHLVRI
jgi:hypothetical protein